MIYKMENIWNFSVIRLKNTEHRNGLFCQGTDRKRRRNEFCSTEIVDLMPVLILVDRVGV